MTSPDDFTFTGLIWPDESVLAELDQESAVSAGVSVYDLENWESMLTPDNDPRVWGLTQHRQVRNDCQGNAVTTATETIEFRRKGRLGDLSRTWAYQQSEIIDGSFGRDRGTTIPAGVRVAKELGFPLESEYPYDWYTRDRALFNSRQTSLILDSAATRKIHQSIPAHTLSFEEAAAYVVCGNPIHWGTWWGLEMDSDRVVRRYKGRHGRGGHATAIVWARKTSRGELQLGVMNSHGDRDLFWITETAYYEMVDRNNSPFGAYVLQGDEQPFYDFMLI